jgi:hypothetical protein
MRRRAGSGGRSVPVAAGEGRHSRPYNFAWLTIIFCAHFLALSPPVHASEIKLWPLFNYRSDTSGHRKLDVLGPVFSYATGPDTSEVTLRPFFSYTRGPEPRHRELTVLYPFWISRWSGEETTHRALLLISYRSQPARRPDEWDRRFTIFPLVFYRHSETLGTWLSVLPFYANVRDFLGYERIQMVLFPFYLHLREPLIERTWVPFPFAGWTGGTLGRGWRLWPFYGWQEKGEQERFEYVMWPFYIVHERHFTRPDRERRVISGLFYWRTDSPDVESRSYAGPFLTHTIDHKAHTDTWGFPWPFWVSRRDLITGERTAFRIAPFYEDTHLGNVHSHFILWPVYRWRTQAVGAYEFRRSDVLLVLYRHIEEAQPEYGRTRRLRTLFPALVARSDEEGSELSAPALLDALYPHNPAIKRLYAPLWQLYTRTQEADRAPHWSLLWDLISSDGQELRYPVHLQTTD